MSTLKRDGTHQRARSKLCELLDKLKVMEGEIIAKAPKQDVKPSQYFLLFDDQRQNTEVRQLIFLGETIVDIKRERSDMLVKEVERKKEDTEQLIKLYAAGIIPAAVQVSVDDGFCDYTLPEYHRRVELEVLEAYCIRLRNKVAGYKRPEWFNDPHKFFKGLIDKVLVGYDEELCFFPLASWQSSLDNSFVNCSQDIDKYVHNNLKDMSDSIQAFCKHIIPHNCKTMKEQSVALLMLYRSVLNRAAQLHFFSMYRFSSKHTDKFASIAAMPVSSFTMPDAFSTVFDADQCIRNEIRKDAHLFEASKHITNAILEPSPLDALWSVYMALNEISNASSARSGAGIPEIIAFDDMFSLFFGAFLASDLTDPQALLKHLQRYCPRKYLSPSFEYALANLEALVIHFNAFEL